MKPFAFSARAAVSLRLPSDGVANCQRDTRAPNPERRGTVSDVPGSTTGEILYGPAVAQPRETATDGRRRKSTVDFHEPRHREETNLDSFWAPRYHDASHQNHLENILLRRPVTVVTEENVRKIEKLVLADRRIKLWQIAEELQISKERVGEIIHEHMNMRKSVRVGYQNANAV
ncbi:Putative uncharacterized protein FLJ37770 [Eumeta japonica]|uniref:Uncharacterized protein n=1 Tax=Eumeta variegata TaxID=151549 RepID=A0A4C1TUC2_EUMVA|nr:Putative uncharacterized protein FLJ37770 [Eumeta japonica]